MQVSLVAARVEGIACSLPDLSTGLASKLQVLEKAMLQNQVLHFSIIFNGKR